MIKRLVIWAFSIISVLCGSLLIEGVAADVFEQKTKSEFYAWQREILWAKWNGYGRFEGLEENAEKNLEYLLVYGKLPPNRIGKSIDPNLVVALSGQWGRNTDDLSAAEKTRWLYGKELPLVLFGDRTGGSPLHNGIVYKFGVRTGKHQLSLAELDKQRHLLIKVYDHTSDSTAHLYEEKIVIPFEEYDLLKPQLKDLFELQWNKYLEEAGGMVELGSEILKEKYGLETWLQYSGSKSAWGASDASGLILSHRGSNNRYSYVVQLMNQFEGQYRPLYVINFSKPLPSEAVVMTYSLFMREPLPAGYWGTLGILNNGHIKHLSNATFLAKEYCRERHCKADPLQNDLVGLFLPEFRGQKLENDQPVPEQYLLDQHHHERDFELLNQFVKEHPDPLVLASYVQNEIELISGVGIPDLSEALTIHPGKINRSPLVTFLEGQGSPWEHCELLVYLLRQAGYAAAYAESTEPLFFLRSDFSRLLRLQLDDAVDFQGNGAGFQKNPLVRVRYPWVIYYDSNQQTWIHLFPWIKETKVNEGYDLYGLMPAGYKTAIAWAKKYLQNDPEIIKQIALDGNDTAALLFKRFVAEQLSKLGIAYEAVGVRYQNLKKNFTTWQDFPKPIYFEGPVEISSAITSRDELYTTIELELSSLQNPQKKVTTPPLRFADIYQRAWYLYFKPITQRPDETSHELVLRMEGAMGFTAASGGTFEGDLLKTQERRLLLDRHDQKLRVRLTYDQHLQNELVSYPEMAMVSRVTTGYTITKGVLAAICFNIGRVNKPLIGWQNDRFAVEKSQVADTDKLGRLAYLAGLAYFEKVSKGNQALLELHKIIDVPGYRAGLSKLSPDFNAPNTLNQHGELVGSAKLELPQIDMQLNEINHCVNGGIRPDLGEEINTVKRDYEILSILDSSANEHQVINDFYQDQAAVSTVKLLQAAHEQHQASGKAGSGFLIFTRDSFKEAFTKPKLAKEHYFSHLDLNLTQLIEDNYNQWEMAARGFHFDLKKRDFIKEDFRYHSPGGAFSDELDSRYSLVYMTPKKISNQDRSYQGYATLVLTPRSASALISDASDFIHGGYGTKLPAELLATNNLKQIELIDDDSAGLRINVKSDQAPPYWQQHLARCEDEWCTKYNLNWWETDLSPNTPKWQDQYQHLEIDEYLGELSARYEQSFQEISSKDLLPLEIHDNYPTLYRKLADPIDIASGAFYLQETDLSIKGPLPFAFKRYYSSNARNFLGKLGYGWQINWLTHLIIIKSDLKSGDTSLVQAAESDGTVLVYRQVNDNLWHLFPKDNLQLTAEPEDSLEKNIFSATIVRKLDEQAENYYLYGGDGSVRYYQRLLADSDQNSKPRLKYFQDARKNRLTFEYGENPQAASYDLLTKIINTGGDYLAFKYNELGKIIEVYSNDGRMVHYHYDKLGDLIEVVAADGTVTSYTYANQIINQAQIIKGERPLIKSSHLLTYQEKPDGRKLQNIYDDLGRVITQKSTSNSSRLLTSVKINYVKEATATDPVALREVVDALGAITKYQLHNTLITQITDPLNNQTYQSWYLPIKDHSNQESKKEAPNLLKERIDKRGLITKYYYDQLGRLIKKEILGSDLSGNGNIKQLITEYTYSAIGQLTAIKTNPYETKFYYNDLNYPRLPTKIEQLAGGKITEIYYYHYGSNSLINGLLLSEIRYYANEPKEQLRTNHLYNDRGLLTQLTTELVGSVDGGSKSEILRFEYDKQHNLAREISAGGAITSYLSDIQGRIIGIIKSNAKGKQLQATYYHYNATGDLEWIKGAHSPYDLKFYNYDAGGNLVFEANWRLELDDPAYSDMKAVPIPGYQAFLSQAIVLRQYDELSRLISSFDAEGNATVYEYNALGYATSKVINDAQTGKVLASEKYKYEPGGLVSKIIYPDGTSTNYQYTTNGLLKQEELPNGVINRWEYDSQGRVTFEGSDYGTKWQITHDDVNHSISRAELTSNRVELAKLNLLGKVKSIKIGNHTEISYSYDASGRVITEDQRGTVTNFNYSYDELGNLVIQELYADGTSKCSIIDAADRMLSQIWYDAKQAPFKTITFNYYPGGKVCVIKGAGETEHCQIVNPDGNSLIDMDHYLNFPDPANEYTSGELYQYDRNGNLVEYLLPKIRSSIYRYDGLGRLIQEIKNNQAPSSYEYDLLGRLIKQQLPKGLTWQQKYFSVNDSVSSTVWGNNTIQSSQRQIDEPLHLIKVTDSNGYQFVYQTDLFDRLAVLEITHPGQDFNNKTIYQYDDLDNLLLAKQQDSFSEITVKQSYDDAGNLIKEIIYDQEKIIATWEQKWSSSGKRIELNLSSNDQDAAWHYQYHPTDQLAQVIFEAPNDNQKLSWNYQYSAAGLLTERKTPWGLVSITYDRGAHPARLTWNHKLFQELIWRLDGKLMANRFIKGNDSLSAMIYAYTDQGRLVGEHLARDLESEGAYIANDTVYEFDWKSLDGLGIRTTVDISGLITYRFEAPNPVTKENLYARIEEEIISRSQQNYLLPNELAIKIGKETTRTLKTDYDQMGRVVKRVFKVDEHNYQEQLLTWDPLGRLIGVTLKAADNRLISNWHATYDAFSRRLKTVYTPYQQGGTVDFKGIITQFSLYDPEVEFLELGTIIKVADNPAQLVWKIYGASSSGYYGEDHGYGALEGVVVTQPHTNNSAVGVIKNSHGVTIATVDDQELVWQDYSLSSYGPSVMPNWRNLTKLKAASSIAKLIIASNWQNKTIDPTGFINFGARYYDPVTGRFLSCDPLGHLATPDLYAYADSDPVNNFDPDGRFASEVYETLGPVVSDVALDYIPVTDFLKGGYEAISGVNPITGEALGVTERILSGASSVTSAISMATPIGLVGKPVIKGAKQVLKNKSKAASIAKRTTKQTKNEGIIYKRTRKPPDAEQPYIGQSKSVKRYEARKLEHNRRHKVEHNYDVLEKNIPRKKLDYLEEKYIKDNHGLQKDGGPLVNKRHQMTESRFEEAKAKFNPTRKQNN